MARLHIASWRAAYRNELPAHYLDALDEGQRSEYWRARLQESLRIILAEQARDLLGFCAHGPARGMSDLTSAWEIYALHVSPELRGSGIGSVLFAEAVSAARAARSAHLALWVLATNSGARRFYEAKGMQADGVAQQRAPAQDVTLHEVRYSSSL